MVYLIIFFALPFFFVGLFSVGAMGLGGQYTGEYTLRYYERIVNPEDFLFLRIIGDSLQIGLYSTLLCFLIGYPLAYFIAKGAGTWKDTALILVIVPFWTSFLIRTYSLMAILHDNGPLNAVLVSAGLQQTRLLYTAPAAILGIVYNYLFYMVLPLYANIEKFDERLVEAAYTLGAKPWTAFFRVILPQTKTGIAAGSILVFILTSGEFVIPALMGGVEVFMISQAIFNQFLKARNWWMGSALSIVLIAIVLLLIIIYMRYIAKEEGIAL